MIKGRGESKDSRRITMSVIAAISPNETNWGRRGVCLGFLVYLFSALTHPQTSPSARPNHTCENFNWQKTTSACWILLQSGTIIIYCIFPNLQETLISGGRWRRWCCSQSGRARLWGRCSHLYVVKVNIQYIHTSVADSGKRHMVLPLRIENSFLPTVPGTVSPILASNHHSGYPVHFFVCFIHYSLYCVHFYWRLTRYSG